MGYCQHLTSRNTFLPIRLRSRISIQHISGASQVNQRPPGAVPLPLGANPIHPSQHAPSFFPVSLGRFMQSLTQTFARHRAGGSSNVPVCGSIWKRGITRLGKIGLFSLAPVMLEAVGSCAGGQAGCKEAAGIQRNYLPALRPSWTCQQEQSQDWVQNHEGWVPPLGPTGSPSCDMLPTAVGAR